MALCSRAAATLGIHAAAQAEDHLFPAHLFADVVHRLVDVIEHRPVLAAAADVMDKIGDDLAAPWRVRHLGMKLQAEDFPGAVFQHGVLGILRDRDGLEAVWNFRQLIAVGIPDLEGFGQVREERAKTVLHLQRPLAVFALETLLDLAAEIMGDQLQPVTNAEDRHAEVEYFLVRQRRVRGIDARRPAGKNDPPRLQRDNFRGRRVVTEDDGINVAFADAARDDLRVLGTKIQNDYLFVHADKRKVFAPARSLAR